MFSFYSILLCTLYSEFRILSMNGYFHKYMDLNINYSVFSYSRLIAFDNFDAFSSTSPLTIRSIRVYYDEMYLYC